MLQGKRLCLILDLPFHEILRREREPSLQVLTCLKYQAAGSLAADAQVSARSAVSFSLLSLSLDAQSSARSAVSFSPLSLSLDAQASTRSAVCLSLSSLSPNSLSFS